MNSNIEHRIVNVVNTSDGAYEIQQWLDRGWQVAQLQVENDRITVLLERYRPSTTP